MIKAICFDAFGTICDFSMGGIVVYDETTDIFNTLRKNGYKVGIISNINRMFGEILIKKLPFSPDCFSAPYLSGSHKPDIGAFAYAANELNLPASEILMIGDSFNNDYMGAKNAGMSALFLDTRGTDKTIESITNINEVINHDYLV